MAALTSISIEEDQFSCPVCLEVLRDPVTIPCGHSYCWDCIEDYWNRTEHRGSVCCPQCRQLFNPRPALSRNTVLWGVVERLQHSESHPVGVHREPLRGKAASSSPPRPTRDPRCPHHEHQALREYCWTDRQCVCARCVTGKHWGHDTGPLGEARAAHQRKLADASFKSIRKSKEIKKELRYIVRYIKHSTQAAMDESERTFSKLWRSIEKHRSEVQDLIRGHEQTALRQADQLLGQVEREGREMERRDTELEKLSSTEDDVQFLQKCKFLHFTTKTVDLPSTDVLPYQMYKSMKGALVELRETLAEMCESELLRVSDKVTALKEAYKSSIKTETIEEEKDVDLLHSSEPRVRDDFLQYYNDLSLDANTANPYLILSTGRRGVTTWSEPQPYPEHPARFTRWAQVLCRAGVAGRCYWEVEWRGGGGVSVGVCYKGMAREGAGSDCKLGHNSKSWSLDCSPAACSFQHNTEAVAIATPCANRIGVYLDYRAGALSFYSVPEEMVLLHRVTTTFTQPLFPGFWVGLGSTLRLCTVK